MTKMYFLEKCKKSEHYILFSLFDPHDMYNSKPSATFCCYILILEWIDQQPTLQLEKLLSLFVYDGNLNLFAMSYDFTWVCDILQLQYAHILQKNRNIVSDLSIYSCVREWKE